MRWLIDGYNVIRRDPGLHAAEQAGGLDSGRRALLRVVAGVALRSPDGFTVVFDGALPHGRDPVAGRVEVVFSKPPRTADHLLAELVQKAGAGGAVVVSSDRAVRSAAQRARCAVVSAEEFLSQVERGAEGAPAKDDDDDDDDRPSTKRGNPRRTSRKERETRRALGRLQRPGPSAP